MTQKSTLYEFGFNFCGPILYKYVSEVNKYLQGKQATVYCLAREGFIFQQALSKVNNSLDIQYLYASRTFLFRILIDKPSSWKYSIKPEYSGSFKNFLFDRFGFSQAQIDQLNDKAPLSEEVSLPEDFDKVTQILTSIIEDLSALVKPTRETYLLYLSSKGLLENTPKDHLFLDIGYSGTIQKLLTLLLNIDTKGYYFITTDAKNENVDSLKAQMHYVFRDKVKMGEGYYMLDRSMFLESLFTSPDGQFIDIFPSPSIHKEFLYCFGKRAYTQKNFQLLNFVFEGSLSAIEHLKEHKIEFSTAEIEQLYQQSTSSRHNIPSAAWPLFEFDDTISGFGTVKALQFFGI